ncbi:hypothetical protein evm_004568 [Chilo suppressalis]|nr:hypothetical protein evm_004568 [Chilo suppressalis]
MRFGIFDGLVQGLNQMASVLTGVQDTVSIILSQNEEQIDLNTQSEDAHLNITQLTAKYGYPFEEHSVTTEDGYIIKLHRIPCGRNNETNNLTIFLMHGFVDSSDSWVLQGIDKALAYILADRGFDVWMGNARGNKHALRHTSLNTNQSEFWDFTWEEIGTYDLPAMIDYTLNVTEKENLYYIGYSQGTTSFYVMNSMKPEYNEKIKLMFALAPVAWMANVRSPLVKMFSPASNFLGGLLLDYNLSSTEFLESVSESICGILGVSCNSLLYMIVGHDSKNMNDIMPVVLSHMPTTSSTLQLVHYGQLVGSGRFCRFDHGPEKNMEIYGTESPPDYDLNNVTVPVVLYFSDLCREAARASLSRQLGANNAENALKACVERSGGRLVARQRLPRHCTLIEGVTPYSQHAALGLQLLTLLGRGHYVDTDVYIAHAHLGPTSNCTLLISTQHIFMVRAGSGGSWHAEWAVTIDDVIDSPAIQGDRLVLNIKQDEMVNYFSTDEKVIEVSDPEILTWLKSKIETALILSLEDKRCPNE